MKAVAQASASAWVSANAGSGKTYVLVTRLVALMLSGVAPEKLLCLTYTRSAAAEMQERLFALLSDWTLLSDAKLAAEIEARLEMTPDAQSLRLARTLFARALETPGGLRIQTIHGFCESVLKRFPIEAGLSPQFKLLDDQQARAMQPISCVPRSIPTIRSGAPRLRGSRAISPKMPWRVWRGIFSIIATSFPPMTR